MSPDTDDKKVAFTPEFLGQKLLEIEEYQKKVRITRKEVKEIREKTAQWVGRQPSEFPLVKDCIEKHKKIDDTLKASCGSVDKLEARVDSLEVRAAKTEALLEKFDDMLEFLKEIIRENRKAAERKDQAEIDLEKTKVVESTKAKVKRYAMYTAIGSSFLANLATLAVAVVPKILEMVN